MSSELSDVNIPLESDPNANPNRLLAKRYVRIPLSTGRRFPMILFGLGTYAFGVGLMLIIGSVLFSGFLAIIGTGMIVVGMHFDEKARNGW